MKIRKTHLVGIGLILHAVFNLVTGTTDANSAYEEALIGVGFITGRNAIEKVTKK